MANCTLCRQPAGFLHFQHRECRAKHDTALAEIHSTIQHVIASPESNIKGLSGKLSNQFATSFVRPDEIKQEVKRLWTQTVGKLQEEGHIDNKAEQVLSELPEEFSLTRAELDAHDSYMRFVKLCALSDLMRGTIPKRCTINGPLSVNLAKDEQLIWAFRNIAYLEEKTSVQYRGGTSGVSVRIMKGVYYRTSSFKGYPVAQTAKIPIDNGIFVVTDKNIYFAGQHKAFKIPYKKIVSFTPYSDGIGLIRDAASARPQIFVTGDGWFTYNLVINSAHLA